jgi:2-iminobutanoate/2-iminopropanoate deaminase
MKGELQVKKVIGNKLEVPLSEAIKTENFIFVSGNVAKDKNGEVHGDIKEQTRIVLDKIKSILALSGNTLEQVVKTTVFITDKEDFLAMNAVYAEYFPIDPPARSCVCVDLIRNNAKIEIEAIAVNS